MIANAEVRVAPGSLDDREEIARLAARALGVSPGEIGGISVLKRSIDARRSPPVFVLRLRVALGEETSPELGPGPGESDEPFRARDVSHAEPVIVVGGGPAGLFAALDLIERGLRPIVLERGRDVRGRRRDVARLCREGVVDPESNYCFGEGGAGTFSDGKLYTRSTKRGDVRRILSLLVQHGAPRDILIDAHPHVGTNRLPAVVQAIGEAIVASGGELRFETRVDDLILEAGCVAGVVTATRERVEARNVVLATGHSARDVFRLLRRLGLALEPKPFAIGVRVEHPQALVDRAQYGFRERPAGLPPASYALTTRVAERGVYSFCMCPGGIVCPAATAEGEVVVNGWSPSSRGLRFANAGIVADVIPADLAPYDSEGALAGVALQAALEAAAFEAGGGGLLAPAQRVPDLLAGRATRDLPRCSYRPGITAADLRAVLPPSLLEAIRGGIANFSRRLDGFAGDEAVVVAVESRTSSPVRIPRDPETLMHPRADGLFPCGEGAGYAGGIVSAALDGVRAASAVARRLRLSAGSRSESER